MKKTLKSYKHKSDDLNTDTIVVIAFAIVFGIILIVGLI